MQICVTSPRKNEVEKLGGTVDWSFMLLAFPLALFVVLWPQCILRNKKTFIGNLHTVVSMVSEAE